jgi:hypothetical protein
MLYENYNVVALDIDEFYDAKTPPDEKIYTFSRRTNDEPLSKSWKIARWEEIDKLMREKREKSAESGENCTLIDAARNYFNNNLPEISEMTNILGLSLPEISLVIKQNNENRIFIPNISIGNALKGRYFSYIRFKDFFSSDSFLLIRNLAQYTAANPDPSLDLDEQNARYFLWVSKNAKKAEDLLRDSLEFHPGQPFVEGVSPDISLKEVGHLPYEKIVQHTSIKRTLDDTINNC